MTYVAAHTIEAGVPAQYSKDGRLLAESTARTILPGEPIQGLPAEDFDLLLKQGAIELAEQYAARFAAREELERERRHRMQMEFQVARMAQESECRRMGISFASDTPR